MMTLAPTPIKASASGAEPPPTLYFGAGRKVLEVLSDEESQRIFGRFEDTQEHLDYLCYRIGQCTHEVRSRGDFVLAISFIPCIFEGGHRNRYELHFMETGRSQGIEVFDSGTLHEMLGGKSDASVFSLEYLREFRNKPEFLDQLRQVGFSFKFGTQQSWSG